MGIGEQRAAMERVRRVLDDRRGFHTDDLDETTRDDLLAAIVGAVESSTDEDESDELAWTRGQRAALTSMLAKILGDLGYQDTEATRSKWIVEREQTIAKLREVCGDHGDNDWTETLHLADIIDKHLARQLEDRRR